MQNTNTGPDSGPDVTDDRDGNTVGAPPDTSLDATPATLSNVAPARFEFSSDASNATFECSVNDGPATPCTSPVDIPVTDGDYAIAVAAIDSNNQRDATPATFAWTVDLTPPSVSIIIGPAEVDNSIGVEFAFSATEQARFSCKLDSEAAVDCTSPFTVAGLTEGDHELLVSATDIAGNESVEPASHRWTVDLSTPDTQIGTGPTGDVSDTGATFTFTSTEDPTGLTFECSLDAEAFSTCTSPLEVTSLAEGPHEFEVRVRDAVGNVDPTPASRTWTVDTVAPTATITGGPNGPTSETQPSFTFETDGNPTTIECRFDAEAPSECTSPIAPVTALPEGAHVFEVVTTDAAGNSSATQRNFTIDTMGPTATITGGPSGPTSNLRPTFTFSTDASATSVQCNTDNATYVNCDGSFTTETLNEGAHTFYLRARDVGGNETIQSRGFTVDTSGPTIDITTTLTLTNNTRPMFLFTTGGSPTSVRCGFGTTTAAGSYSACGSTYAPVTALDDGKSHALWIEATDAAGNKTTKTSPGFEVDTVAPALTVASPTSPTANNKPEFSFSATGSPSTVQCRMNTETYAACTSPYTATALGEGTHTFYVQARDLAGNIATSSAGITVDTVGPTVGITTTIELTNQTTPTFWFTTTGSPTSVRCAFGTTTAPGTYAACSSPYTSASVLSHGTNHAFWVEATDAVGNRTVKSSAAFEVDTVAPSLSIATPASPTTDNTPEFRFTAEAGAASVQCKVGTASYVACTSPYTPATSLPDGTSTLTVKVEDAAGNSTSKSTTVTIDSTGPTLVWSPSAPPATTDAQVLRLRFAVGNDTLSVTCQVWGGWTLLQNEGCASGYIANLNEGNGLYTLIVTAKDVLGNETMIRQETTLTLVVE